MAVTYDLAVTPFSRFGSFYTVAIWRDEKAIAPGIYLSTHHRREGGVRQIFRLDLLVDGKPVRGETVAEPTRLVLRGPGRAAVTVCIPEAGIVRIRGEGGAGLRLQIPEAAYPIAHPAPNGLWLVNHRCTRTRHMLDPLRGRLAVDAPWAGTRSKHAIFRLLPDDRGICELAIDEFRSTWVPRPRPTFAACLKRVRTEFAEWLAAMPSAPASLRATWELAAYLDWSAVVDPSGLFARPAMLMSKRTMDQVWSWDHCFNAMALAYGNPELAWDQFMVVADRQDVYGAFPDAMNDVSMHFNFSKPPVHGWALRFLRQRQPRFVNRPRRAVAYEWLSNWTDWWLTHRRWPGDALPHYLHGNDSGWDNSTMFDRGVPLVAPDLAALLVLQTEELADLATTLRCPKDARRWQRLSAGLLDSLLTELWDGERFIARKQPEGLVVESASLIPNVPIVLGHRLPEAIRTKIVARIPDYLTPWGLATEPPTSPKYEADGYWRGPVWAPPTLLIVDGLARIGERRLAREIARRFCRSCAESGFAENFDALTGAGLRDRAYTWTASVFLVLAHEFLREP